METWQLQDAKNRFSEVVEKARTVGPQLVTRRGVEAVVILSHEEYARLAAPRRSLLDLMRTSPMKGVKLNTRRLEDPPRDLDL